VQDSFLGGIWQERRHCSMGLRRARFRTSIKSLELNYLSTCRFEYFTVLNTSRIWILDSFEYFTVLSKI
jgi:hypothetical protein